MQKRVVYILHKNGAKSHYTALDNLLKKNDTILKHREFSVFGTLFKSIISLNGSLLKKQLINFIFLLELLLSKNKKIVLGIAPFDKKLVILKTLLKSHQIYYHTSWTCWDGSFHPKRKKNTPKVKKSWKLFLKNDVKHIFTVTEQSKKQLIENYDIKEDKIDVVYHALDSVFFNNHQEINKKPLSFIYLGRLLPQKGITELLDFFSKQNKATLTIIGNGKTEKEVADFASKHESITHYPFIKDQQKIINLISNHEYLVLNSKKTTKWEELFGLVIIECMSQGTIPIATNHSGPKEIITSDIGYLSREGEILSVISKLIKNESFDEEMSKNARKKALIYKVDAISERWKAILN
ncbi:glycosyltransferase [Algibacter miyuki]|uniref:Glycosyltransferase n=1 Tax=Algibacter miyuki TaxID=1306933 RepID=A0ABV5H342_9FLAO|nr:glycosyltransferase [Algibacter miyuki]MDN3665387.1 glycosyltransferase [Algibacter miyuki]